jgi:hypothetical protein
LNNIQLMFLISNKFNLKNIKIFSQPRERKYYITFIIVEYKVGI